MLCCRLRLSKNLAQCGCCASRISEETKLKQLKLNYCFAYECLWRKEFKDTTTMSRCPTTETCLRIPEGFFYTIKVVSRCNGPFQILFQHVQLIVSPLTMDKPVLNPRAIFLKGNNHLYIQVCENKSIVIWSKLVWYTYIRGTHNTHWPYRINRSFFSLVSLDGKPTKKLDFERLISIGSLIARHLAWNWAIEIDRKVLIDPTIITLVVWRLLFPPLFIRLTTLQFKCFI